MNLLDDEDDLVVEEDGFSDEVGDINCWRSFSFRLERSSLSSELLLSELTAGLGLKSSGRNLVTSSCLIGMSLSLWRSEKLWLILLVSGTFFPSSISSLSSETSGVGLDVFFSFDLREVEGLRLSLGFSEGVGILFSTPLLPRSSRRDCGLRVVVVVVLVVASEVLKVNRLSLAVVCPVLGLAVVPAVCDSSYKQTGSFAEAVTF